MAQQRLYAVALTTYRDRGGHERTRWTRVGAAFMNNDGTRDTPPSINVELEALPVSGRMQIRSETPAEADSRERTQQERGRSRDERSNNGQQEQRTGDQNREDAMNRSGYDRR